MREAYSAAPGYMSEEIIRSILGAFLFTGDDADKKVKVLSGGEKSRLILAKLLINPPNFLLLDEPTIHLDVDAVEALVQALNNYQGTLVFISHDIYFVRSIANVVYEVKGGRIRKFPGSFDYYFEKKDSLTEEIENKGVRFDTFKEKQKEERLRAKEEDKLKKQEEKKRKAHNSLIREKINKLVKEKDNLQVESYAKARALSNPRIYRDEETAREYGRRMKEIEKRSAEINLEVGNLEKEII
ncbi:MAG: putative ABC transporter ATP-binding protein [Firmicutes bacterium ADurb.Bin300]|nr:MAG: putative ABC transporter ATP-binding protein [Firmicutes bacterium ADurb.Bin300]